MKLKQNPRSRGLGLASEITDCQLNCSEGIWELEATGSFCIVNILIVEILRQFLMGSLDTMDNVVVQLQL